MLLATIPYYTFPTVELGPLTIRTFGLFVAIGILAGHQVGRRALEGHDVDLDRFDVVVFRSVAAGLVGARLTWVLSHLEQIDSPLDLIAVWDGGLQFSGGFVAGVLVALPWIVRQAPPARRAIGDAAALGIVPALAIGRVGCIAVGEHFGGPTDFFLATRYLGGDVVEGPLTIGVAYHHTAWYELLHLLVLGALLVWLHGSNRLRVGDGRTAAAFLLWYAAGRFLTDLTRTADAEVLGLTGAQWVTVAILLPAGLAMLRAASASSRAPELGVR